MILPHFAIEVCRQRLSPAHLISAAMTAQAHTPQQALAAGFIDELTSPDLLPAAVQAQVARLKKLSPKAFAASKARIRASAFSAMKLAIEQDIIDWKAQLT
jgi:enoyl-CoA hydratase